MRNVSIYIITPLIFMLLGCDNTGSNSSEIVSASDKSLSYEEYSEKCDNLAMLVEVGAQLKEVGAPWSEAEAAAQGYGPQYLRAVELGYNSGQTAATAKYKYQAACMQLHNK